MSVPIKKQQRYLPAELLPPYNKEQFVKSCKFKIYQYTNLVAVLLAVLVGFWLPYFSRSLSFSCLAFFQHLAEG